MVTQSIMHDALVYLILTTVRINSFCEEILFLKTGKLRLGEIS